MKRMGSEEARRRFRDLLDDAQRGESVEVLRHNKPIAVLVPADWYHAAAEQLNRKEFPRADAL